MKSLPHVIISASAGSGKTYELVRRYVHLLSLGVEPERIAAMTFTRKAAGEFFNRILRRLAELSNGRDDPDKYFAGMEPLPPQWPDFTVVTRQLLRHMHRLRLGTLDSFFATISACFPMELGLPVGASVMAEDDAKRALDEALDELMDRVYHSDGDTEARTLLEGYKLGTYGREDKSVLRSLRGWISSAHQLWLECPAIKAWGHADVIWPGKSDALIWKKSDSLPELATRLRDVGALQKWSAEGEDKWATMVAQVLEFRPGMKIEKPLAELLEKCADEWTALQAGSAEFPWGRRKTVFAGAAAETLTALIRKLATMEFLTQCERTQGVASVISAYESGYHKLVRQSGRLSFSDVQRLLANAQEQRDAGVFGAEEGNAGLWYRLDGRYDHWLFDEFQDTSVQQWQVVGDLVDEVLQDTSGQRSFFAVGDTKQSIYMWRRAEPGLFRAVESRYVREEGGLQKRTLARSHRSCQQVLDAVNATFGNAETLHELLPGCFDGWDFTKHESAKPELQGQAVLLFHSAKSDAVENPKDELIAELLKDIRPIERGLSCAILVKRNNTAAELAEYLRGATGFDVISESQQKPATDNPVTLALLSVLQLAAHPGDGFALEHLRMTPLRTIFEDDFQDDVLRLASDTLGVVLRHGFAEFVSRWTSRIGAETLDESSRHRLTQFAEIASEFDETGGRGIDAFLDFARSHGSRAQGSASAVQVMTIHKSKGLEFDVVILPDLDGTGLKALGALGLVKKQPLFGRAEWILQMPNDALAQFDPTLSDLKEQLAQREGFEGLCQLYVAMTRAKLGLYLITKPPPKTAAGAVSEARLLREQLMTSEPKAIRIGEAEALCAARIGEAAWFQAHPIRDPASRQAETSVGEPICELLRRVQPLPRRLTPSEEEAFHITGTTLFAPGRESGRNFGSLVHALLAEVDWTSDETDGQLAAVWKERALDRLPGFERAAQQVLALLRAPGTQGVFKKPTEGATLWRERAFDLLHKGEWISGVMDRVIISTNAEGIPTAAWLIDFKTDNVTDEEQIAKKVAGYRAQIDLYRNALSKLTGLSPEAINASLIFTCEPREERIEALHG